MVRPSPAAKASPTVPTTVATPETVRLLATCPVRALEAWLQASAGTESPSGKFWFSLRRLRRGDGA